MSTLKLEHITNINRSGEDLSIDTNGNVGIGTTSPGSPLHINMGTDKNIQFSGGIGEIGSVPGFQATNDASSGLRSMGMRASTLRFATGSAERVRIEDNAVGIGTDSPSTTDSGYNEGALHVHNATGSGSQVRWTNSTTGTGTSAGFMISKWSDSKTYLTNFDDGADTVFYQSNSSGTLVNTMTLDGDGAVSMPAQPVGYRRNTHTTNGWVTLSNNNHNIFSSWYTPSAWQQNSGADTIDNVGRYYAPKSGWYLVNPEIYATTGSTTTGSYGYLNVYKNGSNQFGGHIINYGGDTNDKMNSNSVIVYMTNTDYIQIGVYVAGSGTFQVYSPYCGYWVRFLG